MLTHRRGRSNNDLQSLALLAVDPALRGVYIWSSRDDAAGASLSNLLASVPRRGPVVRIPASASPPLLERVLDTERTLAGGYPSYRPGLADRAKVGIVLIESTDLLRADTAAALASAVDVMPKDDRPLIVARSHEPPKADCPIASRCAFWVDGTAATALLAPTGDGHNVANARTRLHHIPLPTYIIEEVSRHTAALGCPSPTVDFFVARAARAHAAIFARDHIAPDDVDTVLQLIAVPRAAMAQRDGALTPDALAHDSRTPDALAHDARKYDASPPEALTHEASAQQRSPSSGPEAHGGANAPDGQRSGGAIPRHRTIVTADWSATIGEDTHPATMVVPPHNLFRMLKLRDEQQRATPGVLGARPGIKRRNEPSNGPIRGVTSGRKSAASIAIPPTITAAIPWQRMRTPLPPNAVRIMPEDLRRYRRYVRPPVLYILVVDGSGSMAQSRMQLAKGAALAVLQGAYTQRRYVSLIEFRGREATVLCPPGRSAAAIRRLITGMGSGGGTPLPIALSNTARLAAKWRNRHYDGHVHVVLFTDGKANVPLHDHRAPGETRPHADASTEPLAATRTRRRQVWADVQKGAAMLVDAGVRCHVVDAGASPPTPELRQLASVLGARIMKVASTMDSLRRRG